MDEAFIKQIVEKEMEKHSDKIKELIVNQIKKEFRLINENGNASIRDSGHSIGNITYVDNTAIAYLILLLLQHTSGDLNVQPILERLEKMIEENRKQFLQFSQSISREK